MTFTSSLRFLYIFGGSGLLCGARVATEEQAPVFSHGYVVLLCQHYHIRGTGGFQNLMGTSLLGEHNLSSWF